MLDVNDLMKDLARERPVFHSEADFQHALAWHIREVGLDPRIRLERPLKWPRTKDRIHLDLWLPDSNVAVELKYRTRRLEYKDEDECFDLLDQSAHDTGRYDFLKDVQRLEQLSVSKRTKVQAGLAIMLTNDHLYWEPPERETNDAQFRIHGCQKKEGKMEWSPKASPGTIKGREAPICLRGSYPIMWKRYGDGGDGTHQQFRYLAIPIGCQTSLDDLPDPCSSAIASAATGSGAASD